jgi:hypothetical protein
MSVGEESSSDGLGDNTYPALWRPELRKADERRIRQEFSIPRLVKLCFDDEKKGAIVHTNAHEVCLYETMFRAGFRLPFLRVVRELLSNVNLAPHQIMPNAWRVIYVCSQLWLIAFGPRNFLSAMEFLWVY